MDKGDFVVKIKELGKVFVYQYDDELVIRAFDCGYEEAYIIDDKTDYDDLYIKVSNRILERRNILANYVTNARA